MTLTTAPRRVDGLRRVTSPVRQTRPWPMTAPTNQKMPRRQAPTALGRPQPARSLLQRPLVIEYPDLSTWVSPKDKFSAPTPSAPAQESRRVNTAPRAKFSLDSFPGVGAVTPAGVLAVTKPTLSLRPALRTIRKSVVRSGFSWFLVLSIISASSVGLFVLAEQGLSTRKALQAQAGQAQQQLTQGAQALLNQDIPGATAAFGSAANTFAEIQKNLTDIQGSLRALSDSLPGQPLAMAETLSRIGLHLANAGTAFSQVIAAFGGVETSTLAPPDLQTDQLPPGGQTLSAALATADPSFSQALSELDAALTELQGIKLEQLPTNIREILQPFAGKIPTLQEDLKQLQGLFGVLAQIAGATAAKTYLVALQNPNELRPTGGFMGQFAILKIQNGIVEKLAIKSIYDADGQVRTKTAAPAGLNVISDSFSLRDANWSPDFALSAQTLLDFFRETGDPRFDGVIALNPVLVTDLLSLTGPIDVPAADTTVTEDNFVEEAQYEVTEKDLEREKNFFPNFAQALFEKLFSLDQPIWPQMLQALAVGVVHKDLQVYFIDPVQQQLSQTLASAGQLPQSGDYLAIVSANIGGGKTDSFVQEERALRLTIGTTTIRHELTLKRRDTRDVQFKERDNRHYLRIYVPAGAHLISAEGFDRDYKELLAYPCSTCDNSTSGSLADQTTADQATPNSSISWEPKSNTSIANDRNHTVFANWLTLKVGQEKNVRIVYETPRPEKEKTLALTLWRQPGSQDIPTDLVVVTEPSLGQNVIHLTDGQVQDRTGLVRLTGERDQVIGVLLE